MRGSTRINRLGDIWHKPFQTVLIFLPKRGVFWTVGQSVKIQKDVLGCKNNFMFKCSLGTSVWEIFGKIRY